MEETIDLSQSCLNSQEKRQFYDLLTEYSDVFSLRDEIGLALNMHVELEMLDKKPFFIRPFSVKENIKPKIDKEMEKLTVLGILKKGLSGYSSPAMPIPRKNSDIPRIVADFRYLNTKLLQLNMSFPLVKECIQQIGASQCEVMSVIASSGCISYTPIISFVTTILWNNSILWIGYILISEITHGTQGKPSHLASFY